MKVVYRLADVSIILNPTKRTSVVAAMATTARTATTMSAPLPFRFAGRVVTRNLPFGLNGDDEMRNKSLHRQIDPSKLVPGTGPLHYRALHPRLERAKEANPTTTISKSWTSTKLVKTTLTSPLSEEWTTLQIFIYGAQEGISTETLHYQMNRHSNEQVENSLKRMEITFAKRLQKGKKRQKKNGSLSTTNQQLESQSSSIWKLNADNLEPQEEWVEALVLKNQEFWGQAKQTPLAVRLAVNGTRLDLLVESDPPSIFGVRTFDEFESHLYVGVPLVLDLDLVFCNKVEASWFVNDKLVQRSESLSYTPQSVDMGGTLSVLLRPKRAHHDGRGCEEAYCFANKIELPPKNYIMDMRPTWTCPRDEASKQNIRVLTYNILADQNAFQAPGVPARFYQSYVDASILRRQRRLPLVLQEILSYNADVICLQEVDRSVFHGLFEPVMRHLGYEGFFSEKGTDGSQEGCAMFWSRDQFESVPEDVRQTHLLKDLMPRLETENEEEEEDDDDKWTSDRTISRLFRDRPDLYHVVCLKLGHCVQIVPLVPRGSKGKLLWMSNTHIFYHPDASHIRTLQMYSICRKLGRYFVNRPGGLVVCGDFNANLTDPAGRILVERFVPANAKYLKNDLNRFPWHYSRSRQSFDTDFPELHLPQDERLFPVMRSALSEAAPVTHFILGFQGTLDHIVVGGGEGPTATLEPVSNAPMPSMRDLGRDTAMPSKFLPSDHVSLVAELRFSD